MVSLLWTRSKLLTSHLPCTSYFSKEHKYGEIETINIFYYELNLQPRSLLALFLRDLVEPCSFRVRPFALCSVALVPTLTGIADCCPLSHGPLRGPTCYLLLISLRTVKLASPKGKAVGLLSPWKPEMKGSSETVFSSGTSIVPSLFSLKIDRLEDDLAVGS